jgi:hypothetical protein
MTSPLSLGRLELELVYKHTSYATHFELNSFPSCCLILPKRHREDGDAPIQADSVWQRVERLRVPERSVPEGRATLPHPDKGGPGKIGLNHIM